MFFVGIAGPLMPYLLMTGLIIVLTMDVSMEKLHQPEKEHPDHHLSLLTEGTEINLVGHSDHFYAQPVHPNHPDLAENVYPLRTFLIPPGRLKGKVRPYVPIIAEGYCDCYFGLSPPVPFFS